jgi:hypothetical protein
MGTIVLLRHTHGLWTVEQRACYPRFMKPRTYMGLVVAT